MIVTVIGSRNTPNSILITSASMCKYLLANYHTLRSGAAGGMDSTVEIAFDSNLYSGIPQLPPEIFIPWPSFNKDSRSVNINHQVTGSDSKAEVIASSIHPAWRRCSQGAKKLHTRNVHQILGIDCETPSDLVMYWCEETSDGQPTGGTATAVNLALANNIQAINMKWQGWQAMFYAAINKGN